MDIEKNFGTTVKKWREKLGLSQDQFAKLSGLHRTYICDVERGARNVSLKNVKRLADALGVPLITLFSDVDEKWVQSPTRNDELVDIFLVEDSVDDVFLTTNALKKWHIANRMFAVHDGAAALDFLFATGEFSHRQPNDVPQIILLDLNLPKIDGLEVLRRIKADPRTAAIPVVALTGSKHDRDITECRRLGVENYILKPVDFQSFSEVSLRLNLQWALLKPMVPASR